MPARPEKTELEEGEILVRENLFRFAESPDKKPRLVASQCRACHDVAFPARLLCPVCEANDPVEVLIGPRATVHAHTTVRQTVGGYPDPNLVALVKVADDPTLLIITQIRDCAPEDLAVGMAVTLTTCRLFTTPLGRHVVGYAFVPDKEAGHA